MGRVGKGKSYRLSFHYLPSPWKKEISPRYCEGYPVSFETLDEELRRTAGLWSGLERGRRGVWRKGGWLFGWSGRVKRRQIGRA
jgi:hypothetical protein